MAFMLKVILVIFLFIPSVVLFIAGTVFVAGICLRKKHRIASNILFVIAGIMGVALAVRYAWMFWP